MDNYNLLTRANASRWIAVIAVCTLIAATQHGMPVRAAGTGAAGTEKATRIMLAARMYPPPPMMAAAAALLDADTGQWLYLYHADDHRAMASTTKIMTALLAVEYGHLDDLYTVSHAAATIGETTMGLQEGERVPLHDLLYGLMLPSGNDAAITIAEGLAGSQEAFAHIMNAKAHDLGMRNTHFVTPHGLDSEGHYSSARDMAILAREAMHWPLVRQVVGRAHIMIPATATHGPYSLTNINYFVTWYPGADGVKPGYTGNAGLCQVESVYRHGRHLIGVVMDTPNLYTDIRNLFNYGFSDFTWIQSRYTQVDRPSQTVAAGTASRPALYFPATGHTLSAGFLSFFRTHGGLTTLGYPLTEEFSENGQTVQYLSRARLVFDQRTQASLPTPLGLLSVPDRRLLRPIAPPVAASWRTYFPQTGHDVTWAFRDFFTGYGGVQTFGYPITEKIVVAGQLVQFFNNAEFIWHPTGGSGYVTVAPLGQHLLDLLAPVPSGTSLHQISQPLHKEHQPTAKKTIGPPHPTVSTQPPSNSTPTPRVPPRRLTPLPNITPTRTATPLLSLATPTPSPLPIFSPTPVSSATPILRLTITTPPLPSPTTTTLPRRWASSTPSSTAMPTASTPTTAPASSTPTAAPPGGAVATPTIEPQR